MFETKDPYLLLSLVNTKLRDEISRLMYERTKRNPMILPILLEV